MFDFAKRKSNRDSFLILRGKNILEYYCGNVAAFEIALKKQLD